MTGHIAQQGEDLYEVLGAGPMPVAEVAAATGLSTDDLKARVASGELEQLPDGQVQIGEPL